MDGLGPKLLVATEFPPNAGGGGAAIVRQMLRDWPADDLIWWSCRPDEDWFQFKVGEHRVANIPSKLYPQIRLAKTKAQLLDILWVKWAAAHLRRTIRQLRPDSIWIIPHQWSIPALAHALVEPWVRYHISIHDYPDAEGTYRRLGQGRTQEFASFLRNLYVAAASRDVISSEMDRDLTAATGSPADAIIRAGLEPEDFDYLEQKRTRQNTATIKIGYAGTVVAADSFARFAESLQRIRTRLTKPVELHLFGAQDCSGARWFCADWMIQHQLLRSDALNISLKSCGWGFGPMELADINPRYNRFSLPTKLVSYIAAGLPIITIGHDTSTMARLARTYSFGMAVDQKTLPMMDDILVKMLEPRQPDWDRYQVELLRCARNEFNATVMRATLRRLLDRPVPLDHDGKMTTIAGRTS